MAFSVASKTKFGVKPHAHYALADTTLTAGGSTRISTSTGLQIVKQRFSKLMSIDREEAIDEVYDQARWFAKCGGRVPPPLEQELKARFR